MLEAFQTLNLKRAAQALERWAPMEFKLTCGVEKGLEGWGLALVYGLGFGV